MSTGFPFGAKPPGTSPFGQTPAFGTQQPGSITFGTPATSTAPQFGTAFGAQQPAAGLQFGSTLGTQQTSTGLQFGSPAGATQPSTGLQFGAPASNTFGVPSTAAAPLNFNFSTSQPSLTLKAPTTSLNFAAPTMGAPTTSTGLGFSLGAPATSTGLSFAAPATSGLFAPPASSAPSTGLSFGATPTPSAIIAPPAYTAPVSGLLFGATASTSAPSTGLGTSLGTTATPLSFGTVTSSAAPTVNFGATPMPISFGLGGSLFKPPTSTVASTIGAAPVTTTPPATLGLGGIPATQPKSTASQGTVLPREQPLPNEMLQMVEQFKNFVKEQKSFSSDISRCSIKEFRMVEANINMVQKYLNEIENQLQKNQGIADKLKNETIKGLHYAEMAQRTHDTPPGMQYENTAPLQYFVELADYFELIMRNSKLQIENVDKYVKNSGEVGTLTSQDLALGMRRLHETFVALAGRLQSVHNQVEYQKDQYLHLRRNILKDYTNVFEKPSKESEALNVVLSSLSAQNYPKNASGPTPFHAIGSSQAQIVGQKPPPAYPTVAPLGGSMFNVPTFGTSAGASNTSMFGSTVGSTFGQPIMQYNTPSSSSFQLQKPPVGNKRGKQ